MAASHTGVMVRGNDMVFDAAMRQAGAIRAYNIEEFFDLARALERFGPMTLKGDRLAIATLPGGEAVVVTDLCNQLGFSLARFTAETRDKLKPLFPPWEISGNPFDLGVTLQFHNPLKVYDTLFKAVADDPNVDGLAIQLPSRTFSVPPDFFQTLAGISKKGKPIALWLAGTPSGRYEFLEFLEEQNIVVFPCAEKALQALQALRRSSLSRKTKNA